MMFSQGEVELSENILEQNVAMPRMRYIIGAANHRPVAQTAKRYRSSAIDSHD
jgi:hypothetical protein